MDAGCVDCGRKDGVPECYDFDHLEQFEKSQAVSTMVTAGMSIAELQKEIDKCEVVCAFCHRIRTASRRNGESSTYSSVGRASDS
jgi:hypothetical protein